MDEKNKKSRKEWIKTAAIVFLSVMLVLTFFSNTFMNYSLPEVAGQNAMYGTITAKIRGTGVVESGDPYNVMVKQVKKVESINVRTGDKVQKGDILIVFADEDSEELKEAKRKLENAQAAYDQALLDADVTSKIVADSQKENRAAAYRSQITAAQRAKENAEKELENAKKEQEELEKKISGLEDGISSSEIDLSEEKKNLENVGKAKADAELFVKQLEFNLESVKLDRDLKQKDRDNKQSALNATVSSNDSYAAIYQAYTDAQTAYEKAQKDFEGAEESLETARQRLVVVQAQYDAVVQAYDNKVNGQKSSYSAELVLKRAAVAEKQEALSQKTEALNELTATISKTLGLESLYRAISEAKEEYEKVSKQSGDSVVTAGVSGTVTAVNVASGKETNTFDPVVVIQPEGKGYYLSFSVTNEQAKRLSVGDVADLVNSWRYNDVQVVLSSIKPDKNNPGQNKILTFDVSGDVTPGQSMSVSVGQKSASYDAIVPTSAIREDNNGKFVLVVESKPSPLGNRYVATRMDVQILASDDTQSAVSGLYGYEFVVTTSTKPVVAGQLVRLANTSSY